MVRTLCDETRYEFTICIDRPDHSGTPVTFVLVGLIDRSGDIQWQLEHPAAGTQSIRSSTAEEICRGITEAYIQQLDQR